MASESPIKICLVVFDISWNKIDKQTENMKTYKKGNEKNRDLQDLTRPAPDT